MKKTALFFSALLSISAFVFARAPEARKLENEEAPWRMLEQAVVAFDAGNYGMALNLANKAKENRALQINWELNVLETALSPRQVRKAGDRFSDVLAVLRERDENEAIAVINQYLTFHGESFYSNSVSALVAWLDKSAVYPEADFLTGNIYQLEGEFQLASSFYEKARVEAEFLDVPDLKFDILYAMAELANEQNKLEEYEQALLIILSTDSNFQNKLLQRSFEKIVDADLKENVDRFFTLFRCETNHSILALYKLCLLYKERGDAENVFRCASLGVIESFTHILNSLQERDANFHFTTIADFFEKLNEQSDYIAWMQDTHVWELFFFFVDSAVQRGNYTFGEAFYATMAESLPDAYWQAQAANRLAAMADTANSVILYQ